MSKYLENASQRLLTLLDNPNGNTLTGKQTVERQIRSGAFMIVRLLDASENQSPDVITFRDTLRTLEEPLGIRDVKNPKELSKDPFDGSVRKQLQDCLLQLLRKESTGSVKENIEVWKL